jgi:hypothetical protein
MLAGFICFSVGTSDGYFSEYWTIERRLLNHRSRCEIITVMILRSSWLRHRGDTRTTLHGIITQKITLLIFNNLKWSSHLRVASLWGSTIRRAWCSNQTVWVIRSGAWETYHSIAWPSPSRHAPMGGACCHVWNGYLEGAQTIRTIGILQWVVWELPANRLSPWPKSGTHSALRLLHSRKGASFNKAVRIEATVVGQFLCILCISVDYKMDV